MLFVNDDEPNYMNPGFPMKSSKISAKTKHYYAQMYAT